MREAQKWRVGRISVRSECNPWRVTPPYQPSILAGAFQVFRQSRLDIRHKELPYAHGAARPALLVHIGNQRIERLAALAKLAVPRGQSAGSQLYDQVQCADPAVAAQAANTRQMPAPTAGTDLNAP
jgi:hypothetical protein